MGVPYDSASWPASVPSIYFGNAQADLHKHHEQQLRADYPDIQQRPANIHQIMSNLSTHGDRWSAIATEAATRFALTNRRNSIQ
jgi:hypothetical protein